MKKTILLALACLPVLQSWTQCGVNPTSGNTTISTPNQIVNSYFPGQGNPLSNSSSITVGPIDGRGSATGLAPGDLVMIIQIQGADIDSDNTDLHGNSMGGPPASGYGNNSNLVAGYYEYNTISGVSGGTITFSYSLANNYYTRAFTIVTQSRAYQVIRVPRYFDLDITSTGSVTAPQWNGSAGGVVVLDAANIVTINGSVDVTAKGFRGGGGKNFDGASAGNSNGTTILVNTDYRWNSPVTNAANTTGGAKGESISGTPAYTLNTGATTTTTNSLEGYERGSMGRGAPANGGGGGTDGVPVGSGQNQYNTGGGGGGNAGAGGNGGSGWHGGSGDVTTFPYGGYGGSQFAQQSISKFILGGGGGAGTANNSSFADEYQSSGASGGGIIIIRAKSYTGSGSVNANGGDAPGVIGVSGTTNTDAAGGGGAGGTIVLVISQNGVAGLSAINANAKGGKGGDMTNYYDHGPGGGGGGGIIYANGALASTNIAGGINGKTRTGSPAGPVTNDFGASAGMNGTVVTLSNAPVLVNNNNLLSPCGTLPLTLVKFYAAVKNYGAVLYWQIENAYNFHRFEVEYSLNGFDFSKAGTVLYSTGKTDYSFSHTITNSIIYYRLKMVNINGSYDYSRIVTVKMNRSTEHQMIIYPNPSAGRSTLQFNWNANVAAILLIRNATGKLFYKKQVELQNGEISIPLDLEQLPDGFYFLSLEINKNIIARAKLTKMKEKL